MVVKGENRDTAWYSITDPEFPPIRARFLACHNPANFDATGQTENPPRALTPTSWPRDVNRKSPLPAAKRMM